MNTVRDVKHSWLIGDLDEIYIVKIDRDTNNMSVGDRGGSSDQPLRIIQDVEPTRQDNKKRDDSETSRQPEGKRKTDQRNTHNTHMNKVTVWTDTQEN